MKYTDLINANIVLIGLLHYKSVALDDSQQTYHFIVEEQIFSTSYALLRIRGPPKITYFILKHSFSFVQLFSNSIFSLFFQLFLSLQRRYHFQFTPSTITYFQGKGAQQVSHTCNFKVSGLCKKFVIASDFSNKILFSLKLKMTKNTGS